MEEKTKSERRSFGALEQAILQVFETGNCYTIREVVEKLSCANKYTTILTVMQRLTLKRVLKKQREGRADVYTLVERPNFSTRLLQCLSSSFFKMPARLLARSLAEGADQMEEEELLEIEEWIRSKRLNKQAEKANISKIASEDIETL